jgi:hypothetical protein
MQSTSSWNTAAAVALLKQPGKLDPTDLKCVFLLEMEINRLRGLLDEAGIDWDVTGNAP